MTARKTCQNGARRQSSAIGGDPVSRRSQRKESVSHRLGTFCAIAAASWVACSANGAWALDKQGSAHGGEVGETTGFGLSGSFMLGSALYNPSYAARPDNSGKALLRYAGHADIDLIGAKLSIPLDINFFTDRLRGGVGAIAPSEFDVIGGVTSTWNVGSSAFEFGARIENDRPVDQGDYTQTYGDIRARWLYSLLPLFPELKNALRDGDLHGWLTLGWFGYNKTYAARPDNSGLALFRYGAHGEVEAWDGRFGLGLDAAMFTDSRANAVRPSELDFTVDFFARIADWDVHLAMERDMPLDVGGLVQQMVYVTIGRGFAWQPSKRLDQAQPWK